MSNSDKANEAVQTTATANINNTTTILDSAKPLSKSIIWKLQSDFYENQGPEAWIRGIVPQYITTNPYIANLYAKTVFAYCRDIVITEEFNKDSTIYIMELAAGVGRFTYTFLKRFLKMLEQSTLKGLKFKYLITDLAERNVEYWLAHSYLKPYFESGVLDCATFDMTKDDELSLRYSGEVLSKGNLQNPLILFANYTFDSLPQDTFYVNEGELYEGLITVTSTDAPIDASDHSILAGLDYEYTDKLIQANAYYEEDTLNCLLLSYKDLLNDSAFSVPIEALRCINRLRSLFNDDIVLLSSDKGYRNLSSMEQIYHPFLSKHGSISLTVNFHAMELYFNSLGGKAIHTLYDHENVTMSLFLLSTRPHDFVETTMAFNEIIESIGPDDFYILKKAVLPHHASLTTRELLTFLRYTMYDSRTFLEFYNTLLSRIQDEEAFPREELVSIIDGVRENYFPIGEEGDLCYCLGTILAYFEYDYDAIELFQTSMEFYGEDPSIHYEIALCYYNLQVFDMAIEHLEKSLLLDPGFEDSLNLKGIIDEVLIS